MCGLTPTLIHICLQLFSSHVVLAPLFPACTVKLSSILHIWQFLHLVLNKVINLLLRKQRLLNC